ncbi:MAG: GDP-mannose 4,6-dehydratase [Promethearchaeota archaeon]
MNVLITGGLGFIGFNLILDFIGEYYEKFEFFSTQKHEEQQLQHKKQNLKKNILILDNFSRETSLRNLEWLQTLTRKLNKNKIENTDKIRNENKNEITIATAATENYNIKIANKEIQDKNTLKFLEDFVKKEKIQFDLIYHLAAQVAVTKSILNPKGDFETNAKGALNILEFARKNSDDAILIYSSTNKVYGALNSLDLHETENRYDFIQYNNGINEDFPIDPQTPYGCSKAVGDIYFQDYFKTYGLKTIVFRQSCIYGPHQYGTEDQGWIAHFMNLVRQTKPLKIYGNGKQVRDLLHVFDLIDAYKSASENISQCKGKCYNIGGSRANSLSILQYLSILASLKFKDKLYNLIQQDSGFSLKDPSYQENLPLEILNKCFKIQFENFRLNDQKCFYCDISKAKKDFNWTPKINYKEGIKKLWNFFEIYS